MNKWAVTYEVAGLPYETTVNAVDLLAALDKAKANTGLPLSAFVRIVRRKASVGADDKVACRQPLASAA